MIVYIVAAALIAWGVGLVVYVMLDDGKEKPEGFETDVEHGPGGKKLSKLNPLYWLMVLAEGLWSWLSALVRRALGLPQR